MRGRYFATDIVAEQMAAYTQQLADMAAYCGSGSIPGGPSLQQLHDEAIQHQKTLVEQQQRRRQHLLVGASSQDMGWHQDQQQQQQPGTLGNAKRSREDASNACKHWYGDSEPQLLQPAAAKRQKLQQQEGMLQLPAAAGCGIHGSLGSMVLARIEQREDPGPGLAGAPGFHLLPQQQLQQRGLAARRTSSDGSGNLAALAAAAAATDAAGCSKYGATGVEGVATAAGNTSVATVDGGALAAAKAAHTSICACVVLLKMVPRIAAEASSVLNDIEQRANAYSAAFMQHGQLADSEALQVLLKIVTALTELHLVQQSSGAAAAEAAEAAGCNATAAAAGNSSSSSKRSGVSEFVACLQQTVPEGYSPSGASCSVLELLVHCWVKESELTGCKVESSAAAAAARPIAAAFATDADAAGVPGLSLNCFLAGMSQLALNVLLSCCKSSSSSSSSGEAAEAVSAATAAADDAAAAAAANEAPQAAAGAVSKRMLAVKVLAGCAVLLLHWPEGESCKLERCVQAGLWRQRLLAHADGRRLQQFKSDVSSQLHGFLEYLTKQLGEGAT
jgi:hypothetical protein